ncbi:hypothetical protein [Nocardia rhamnosiphila]
MFAATPIVGCAVGKQPLSQPSDGCRHERLDPPYQNIDVCNPVSVLTAVTAEVFDYASYGGPEQAFHAALPLIDPEFDSAAQDVAPMWARMVPVGARVVSVQITADDHPPDTETATHRIVVVALRRAEDRTPTELVVNAVVARATPTAGWRLSQLTVAS